jgi:cytochrome c oxidase accessory protein FixG
VRSLSGLTHDAAAAARGKAHFATTCAGCHGIDGKGNVALGAPNLTDGTWLYGSSEATIVETIAKGRSNRMPAHREFLGEPRSHCRGGLRVRPVAAAEVSDLGVQASLYEVHRKVYPRAVSGAFARWRWGLVLFTQAVFYGLAWLQWNGRQAVLFDLGERKFHIFGLVFWPQDFIYLAVLLVLAALALFLFTAIAGRLWCGYACPQTVYTEIFMWIERRVEGDRSARMKLDAAPRSARKVALKSAKHATWIALSLWTGFTFVGYFTPIRELALAVPTLSVGGWETFWIVFYGFATYGNAGWMREQVCKYMCPYARFQGVMFDRDTLVIEYDAARGEPRGGRSRSADPKAAGLGDCVDCGICVQVCPTGIDIRQGLQYECIGCAACIDGCNQVMHKMSYAPGLIRYSTENAMQNRWGARAILRRVARARVLAYAAIFMAVALAAGLSLWMRAPVKMDVIRDRASLAREVEGGRIENVYRLQVMNTLERPLTLALLARGGPALERVELTAPAGLAIAPVTTASIPVRVRADGGGAHGSQPLEFVLEWRDAGPQGAERGTERSGVVVESSRFLLP